MAKVNLNSAPYYDKFNPSQGYVQLIAVPGRVAQAREFTEAQSTMRHIIKSIGDSILKNGDVIEGCQILVNKEEKVVTVTSGKVYIEGMVMEVPETSNIPINGEGTETIGIKLTEQIITESDDKDLRDPAQGFDNYNQPGCVRLKRSISIVVNDPSASILNTLIDGDIMVETYAPEYDKLTQTLARRTYDESGSYIVKGLTVRREEIPGDEEYYNIVVEPGKAYVLGYELSIPTARRIQVPKSRTHKSVLRQVNYTSNEYIIERNPYVHSINSIIGEVENTISPSKGTSSVEEVHLTTPENQRVTGVISVTQGNTSYTIGTEDYGDCYMYTAGSFSYLKWRNGGNSPAVGSQYNIKYQHTKEFIKDTEYTLTKEIRKVKVSGEEEEKLCSILKWNTDKIVPKTVFNLNFEIYLARKDIVCIDETGYISVIQGIPDEYGYELALEPPLNTLLLSSVTNPPDSSTDFDNKDTNITVSNVGLTRFTMKDIQKILDRIQTIEYDQAVISLNDDAKQVYTQNDKKGVFTDPLIDYSRVDLFYKRTGEEKALYDMAIDLTNNICYLPVISNTQSILIDEEASNSTNIYDRLISLGVRGENVVASQTIATSTFQVNPYSMFPQIPEISIDPAVDSWFEDTIIEIPVSLNDTEIITLSNRVLDLRLPHTVNNSNWSTRSRTYTRDTAVGTKTDTLVSESVVNETAITYIRQREITVTGTDFMPGLDEIECYFDGVKVPLNSASHPGTSEGTVKADESGSFLATFTIPEHRLSGTREVLLKSKEIATGFITEASALYVAQGIARRIERTVTTVTTVLLERISNSVLTSIYVDPVGQSFVLDRMSLIKGIDIYFSSKPESNEPVTCEIREVLNGTITNTVYARKSLKPDDVNEDPDKGNLATRFNFSDPVLLEGNKEYAFTLRSNSNAYRVWVSELGFPDKNTGETVIRNSYMKGVMFSSSNNSTWTPHQTMDMKFRLIEDIYNNESVLNFKDISVSEAARLYLASDDILFPETSIKWEYRIGGSGDYNVITPYNLVLLGRNVSGNISLRATLSKKSTQNLSPLIAKDTIYLVDSHYETEGTYVSKNISGLDEFEDVRVVLDTFTPSGTSFIVKVDIGDNNIIELEEISHTELSNLWFERTYNIPREVIEGGGISSEQIRIFIEARGSSQTTPAFRRLRCIMS